MTSRERYPRGRVRRARSITALALCGWLATVVPASAELQTIDAALLRVTIDTDWAPRNAPGYFPARFEITNSGDDRLIEIVGQGMRSYMGPRVSAGNAATLVRQVVRLARGDRVRLTIPVPIYANNESIRFEIRERNASVYRFNFLGVQSRVAANDASALVVTGSSALSSIALRAMGPTSGGGARGGAPGMIVVPTPGRGGPRGTLDFQLDPSRLPTNWLGYTSLRAVVLGPEEWDQLTDAQQSALLAWTASGGDLIFVDGDIKALVPAAQTEVAGSPDRLVARHFFGRIHVVTLDQVSSVGLGTLVSATASNRDAQWALPANAAPDWGAIEGRGFRLRIPEIDGVPARMYLGILLLFSVLIGPANYWFLRRRRKQVLMVLTAPLISAAFIVVLAGYAIAGEGFGVRGRAVTFTMLDELSNQAVTRATVSLYAAGLTPSGGLRFGRDVAVWAIGSDGSGIRDRLELDLTDTQHFAAGVLQARAPTNYEQVTVRPARERITIGASGDGLSVTNGLDATIVSLVYRDGDTFYRLDQRLPAGERQTISPAVRDLQRTRPDGVLIPAKFHPIFQHQPSGSYLAVLDRSPFWEPGVSRLVEHGSVHIVLGIPEGKR
jgi:hypothetical protein